MAGREHAAGRSRLRVRGCLLAAACGQPLGAAFDGRGPVDGDLFDAVSRSDEPLRCCGDTVVMLAYAEYLAEVGMRPLDGDRLAAALVAAWRVVEPDPGLPSHLARMARAVAAGGDWRQARDAAPDQADGGSVLMAVPVGLTELPISRVASRARLAAAVSEAGSGAQEAAVVLACAVALAYQTDTARAVDRSGFVHRLRHVTADPVLLDGLAAVDVMGAETTAAETNARLGVDGTARAAVAVAVAAFLRHPDSPVAAVRFAVGVGGGGQAAAMASALAAARTGGTAIPAPWLRRLDGRADVCDVADRLALASGSGRGSPPALV